MPSIPILPNATISRNDGILASDLGKETVMMDIDSGSYYGLGKVGSRIWQLLEKPGTASCICSVLLEEFEVPQRQCELEVTAFICQLAERNLVSHAS